MHGPSNDVTSGRRFVKLLWCSVFHYARQGVGDDFPTLVPNVTDRRAGAAEGAVAECQQFCDPLFPTLPTGEALRYALGLATFRMDAGSGSVRRR